MPTKQEIKIKFPKGFKRQVVNDYHLLRYQKGLTKRNALRTIQRKWNTPIKVIKLIIYGKNN